MPLACVGRDKKYVFSQEVNKRGNNLEGGEQFDNLEFINVVGFLEAAESRTTREGLRDVHSWQQNG